MRAIRGTLLALAMTAVAAAILMFVGCSGPPAGEAPRAAGGGTAGSQGVTGASAAGLRVTVLLDSGRPDPTFTVDDGDAIGELAQLYGQARTASQSAAGRTESASSSGYKGMQIENPGGEGGLPSKITVYQDRIQARDPSGAERFLADGGACESFLIDQGVRSKALDQKAVEQIRAAHARP